MKKSLGCIAVCLASATAAWGAVGGGDITFRIPAAKNVIFSHDSHIMKAKLKCSECHFRLFNTTAELSAHPIPENAA